MELASSAPATPAPTSAPAPMLRASRHDIQRRYRRRANKTRPPPHWFTLGSLRSVGRRLCNPPPPVKEERYIYYLAPRYNILLDDVVAEKHLPPLSRQDFEDYLQHVDGTIQNLYFLEWVQHYRQLYREWAESVLPTSSSNGTPGSSSGGLNIPSTSKGGYRSRDLWERLKDCQHPQLREEFAYAKATFFESNATMRLDICDELRSSVLLIPNWPPPREHQGLTDKLPSFPNQPEPGLFDAILAQTNTALNAAFARFVRLAFCNSGLWHSCIGYIGGMIILAYGLALWCQGIISGGRNWVAGALPLIWFGAWFVLVSANGHCLVIYVTGDARQLYPHEFARPLPPDTVVPPVYSLALRPNQAEPSTPPPTYSFSRKTSAGSHLLPFSSPPTPPPRAYQPLRWASLRSKRSEGRLRLGRRGGEDFTMRDEEEVVMDYRPDDRAVEMPLKLPPARRTKDLPRQSLVFDVEQANALGPALLPLAVPTSTSRRGAVVDLSTEWPQASETVFESEGRPDSPFSEENDFGIVVSEAYEEDSPFYSTAPSEEVVGSSRPAVDEEVAQPSGLGATLESLSPLVQAPECAGPRRRTLPEIFAPVSHILGSESVARSGVDNNSRRGSKSSVDREAEVLRSPWPRRLFGPMTLVHSPLVRRAHWVVTVRSAIVASVLTCGLAFGLAR